MTMITVKAEVDLDEIFGDMTARDLERYMVERGGVSAAEALEIVYSADTEDAVTVAERLLQPKWSSVKSCRKQYNEVMGR